MSEYLRGIRLCEMVCHMGRLNSGEAQTWNKVKPDNKRWCKLFGLLGKMQAKLMLFWKNYMFNGPGVARAVLYRAL